MLNLRLARHCFLLSSLSPPPPLFLLLHLSISLSLPLSIACRTSHRVTDPRHLLSAANCRGGPGLPPFSKFLVPKKRLDNEQFDSDCPEFRFVPFRSVSFRFVSFLVHSPVGIIELLVFFFYLYLYFLLPPFSSCYRFHGAHRPLPADREGSVVGE